MARGEGQWLAAKERHIPRGVFHVHPVFAKEGRGATITSVDGRRYIDFASGIGAVNAGHCPRKVVTAVVDQAEKYLHTCFHVVMYPPYVELAERLNSLTPGTFPKKTLFANSGAEAVENGVKISRYHTGRPGVICFEYAFHGRSLLGMTLTSKVSPYKAGFGPFAPEVYRMPAAYRYRCRFGLEYPSCELSCAQYLGDFFVHHAGPEQIAALIIEPVMGEEGFIVPRRSVRGSERGAL